MRGAKLEMGWSPGERAEALMTTRGSSLTVSLYQLLVAVLFARREVPCLRIMCRSGATATIDLPAVAAHSGVVVVAMQRAHLIVIPT